MTRDRWIERVACWADDHGEWVVIGYITACVIIVMVGALIWSVV